MSRITLMNVRVKNELDDETVQLFKGNTPVGSPLEPRSRNGPFSHSFTKLQVDGDRMYTIQGGVGKMPCCNSIAHIRERNRGGGIKVTWLDDRKRRVKVVFNKE